MDRPADRTRAQVVLDVEAAASSEPCSPRSLEPSRFDVAGVIESASQGMALGPLRATESVPQRAGEVVVGGSLSGP